MRRFSLAFSLAALGMVGCVEGEQTYTLNPDGGGKVRIDVVMTPPGFFDLGPPGQEPDTLDGMRQKALRTVLQSKGVAAWKDVAAGFATDGRFKFAGTAYFDKLDDLELKGTMTEKGFTLAPRPKGGLVFGPREHGPDGSPLPEPSPFGGKERKTPDEYKKMPDAELDEHILADRVRYQAGRPLMRATLAGVKMKTTFVLPGAVKDVAGFKADGAKLVLEMSGDQMLAAMDKLFAKPDAELRPLYRTPGAIDAAADEALGHLGDGKFRAAVPAPGGPQFDYAAEVKAARAAYPALRKALKLPDDVWIPDGNPPPPPKGFPPPPR